MAEANIYDFASFTDYLSVVTELCRSRRSRPLTAEAWAQRLGYKAPQSITMVLNGQRLPSKAMIQALSGDLGLNADERRYFALLVDLERQKRRGKESIVPIILELEKRNPRLTRRLPVDTSTFAFVSEWYHVVIKQLVSLPGFRGDVAWIRERLADKVTAAEVTNGIETMVGLGLLRREGRDDVLTSTGLGVETVVDVPDTAIRHHHRQMMARATEALDEQAVEQREITALTFAFDRVRIGEAKDYIRAFKDDFDARFSAASSLGDAVYQLNVQLFSHTV